MLFEEFVMNLFMAGSLTALIFHLLPDEEQETWN